MSVVHGLIHAARSYATVTLPTVVAIVPNNGLNTGSTHVVIEVDSSTGCVSAALGGVDLTSFAIDDGTHVSGDTVAHSVGSVDVTVTNADGTSAPLAAGYAYNTGAVDPTSVTGLLLWLDSTAGVTQAGTVTAWADQSGGSMTVTIPGGKEPTYNASNADYASAATIDCGSNQGAILSNLGLTTGPFTIVFVADGTDNSWLGDNSGNYLITSGGGSGNKLQASSNAGSPVLVSSVATSGVPGVYVLVFDGVTTSKIYTSAHTASASGSMGAINDLTGLTLSVGGTYNLGGAGLMGSLRHFLIYDGVMSPTDVAYLLDGFGSESGISIGG